jgi:hypothetical protein
MDMGTSGAHQSLTSDPTASNPATANFSHFRGALDRRLQTVNSTRSLAPSPSPGLQEPPPFKQGSPLAPIPDGRESTHSVLALTAARQQQQYEAAQIKTASHRPSLEPGPAKLMKPRDALWNYAPDPDPSRTKVETRQRQGQEKSAPAWLSSRPHDSENLDDASLSALLEDLPWVSTVNPPAELLVSETLGNRLTTTLHPSDFTARLSHQSVPGFNDPPLFPLPEFGVLYSPTGSDDVDAGNITSELALENGTSHSGQPAIEQLHGHPLLQPETQIHRPFRCDQCLQSFHRDHDLKRHKSIHLAVKPFPCGFCDKSFSRKEALKVRSTQIFSR